MPGLTDINEPNEEREREGDKEQVGSRNQTGQRTNGLTWEVTSKLHPPVCRRMKTVIVTWSQIDDDVKQVVIGTRQQVVLEGRRGVWKERKTGGLNQFCRLDKVQTSPK